MAKKSEVTRVNLYKNYRKSISESFESEEKAKKEVVPQPLPRVKVEEKPKVSKAAALINEYDSQNLAKQEPKHTPNKALIGLAFLLFILLVAGVIYMIGVYQK